MHFSFFANCHLGLLNFFFDLQTRISSRKAFKFRDAFQIGYTPSKLT